MKRKGNTEIFLMLTGEINMFGKQSGIKLQSEYQWILWMWGKFVLKFMNIFMNNKNFNYIINEAMKVYIKECILHPLLTSWFFI